IYCTIASSNSSPATRTLRLNTIPESEIRATSVVPPPISMIMLPAGSCTGSPTPIAAAIGDSRRDRDNDAGPRAHPAIMHFADEMTQHRLRNFEVSNDSIFERTHRDNIRRRATEHALGLVTYREHSVGAGLHGHHRRLA